MLSQREQEVLEQVVQGRTTKEIAHQLQLSPRTIEIYRGHVFEKMAVRNAVELTRKVMEASRGRVLHQPGERQTRHVGHVVVGEPPAQPQHRRNTLQEGIAPLGRQAGGGGHDGG